MFLLCFRTYRLNPDIYEARLPLRWGRPHTSPLLIGVLCAGRATSSGGSGRPDGPITPQSQPYQLTLLSDWQGLLPLAGSSFHAFDNDSGLKNICFSFFYWLPESLSFAWSGLPMGEKLQD